MLLTVAIIGSPRGLRGEVHLDLRTDDPDRRLAAGTVLPTEPADAGPLTVAAARRLDRGWSATFAEAQDRTAAEALRGVRLMVDTDQVEDDDEGWYPHELAGLRVEHVDGRALGTVADLVPGSAQDLLVVTEPDGARALIPFVPEIVPVVDPAGGRVVLDPPRGLLAADPAEGDADPAEDRAAEDED
ncbi:ribosome maturation factor RimM [Georgenia sp. 10Sc9-8]|uniref:Ribosome maturation factor RimM n=1 Tax=Georgenia halotolerans TaxID=3028317 RepID=A0ABT5TZ25_9MICO|nr:ribosome maturation factor RimM [Georgenia halotolerans]